MDNQISSKNNTTTSSGHSTGRHFIECSCNPSTQAEDQYAAFGRYVGVEMRNIGDTELELETKRQILNLLFEAQSKSARYKGRKD